MILLRQPLARRTLLRGLGTSLALPFLQAMAPAARAADLGARPKRLLVFYTPNGMTMDAYRPATTGRDFVLPPTLAPLAPHRDRLLVVSGLGHPDCPFTHAERARPTSAGSTYLDETNI